MTNNSLNAVMKRLTAITVILMAPTLIAGIYGMNFDRMPELAWPLGYPFALALMAAVMLGAFTYSEGAIGSDGRQRERHRAGCD